MKKYLGLFLLLLMLSGTASAVANTGGASLRNDASTGVLPPDKIETRRAELEKFRAMTEAEREKLKMERERFRLETEAKREELKKKFETLKTNIKAEKDQLKAKLKEDRIVGRERALEVFDITVARLSELKDKVSAQIAKLEAKGVDVTPAEELIAKAETKLNQAKAKIVEVNNLFTSSTEPLSPENKAKLKALREEVQVLLKEAHSLLKEAVKALRDAIKEARDADKIIPPIIPPTKAGE